MRWRWRYRGTTTRKVMKLKSAGGGGWLRIHEGKGKRNVSVFISCKFNWARKVHMLTVYVGQTPQVVVGTNHTN